MTEKHHTQADVAWVPYDALLLDPANPRLAGLSVTIEQQERIIQWLWKNKAVNELVASIQANGYWSHEELFATEEKGNLVIIEGNRRLAAVKLLMEPDLAARLKISGVPAELPSEVRATLRELPVIVQSREEIWGYIGFKHVNGPQAWDSIAKAEYVYRINQRFGVSPAKIAATIGDEHETVLRLYRGYLVLRQAQDEGLFDPEDSWKTKFPFSHLWVALGYQKVRKFLGIRADRLEKPNPVPKKRLDELHQFMLWLFGSRNEEIEPRVKRQNPDLRNLIEVLDNRRGLTVLRAGLPLPVAFEASLGDSKLFEDALSRGENDLREAKRFVATGFRGDEDLLATAKDVFELARSLYREMSDYDASPQEQ